MAKQERVTVQSDALDTPELVAPPKKADKHHCIINNVKFVRNKNEATGKQSFYLELAMTSVDRNFPITYKLWLPEAFVNDIHVSPDNVSKEPGPLNRKGEPGMSQYDIFAIRVANSKKTAEIQMLRQYAQQQERYATPDAVESILGIGITAPRDIEEFTSVFDWQLRGVHVVAARKPQKSDDPHYDGNLDVRGIYSVDVMTNPNKLKDYQAAWASETE